MALGKTAKYYRDNPDARKKKNEYQKKYNATPKAKKKRAEDNKARKDLGLKKGDPRDASRKTRIDSNGKLISYFTPQNKKQNRGSKDNTKGDRAARGGKTNTKTKKK
jgi:hypothetical protein